MFVIYVFREEVYSPEELLAMIFNASRQFAQDYAGTYMSVYINLYILYCTHTYIRACVHKQICTYVCTQIILCWWLKSVIHSYGTSATYEYVYIIQTKYCPIVLLKLPIMHWSIQPSFTTLCPNYAPGIYQLKLRRNTAFQYYFIFSYQPM